MFDVRDDGVTAGAVWLAERVTEWLINDLAINAVHRGTGFGREAMRRIEGFVSAKGGTAIGLSVFDFNQVAQRLHASERYETTGLSVTTRLRRGPA